MLDATAKVSKGVLDPTGFKERPPFIHSQEVNSYYLSGEFILHSAGHLIEKNLDLNSRKVFT